MAHREYVIPVGMMFFPARWRIQSWQTTAGEVTPCVNTGISLPAVTDTTQVRCFYHDIIIIHKQLLQQRVITSHCSCQINDWIQDEWRNINDLIAGTLVIILLCIVSWWNSHERLSYSTNRSLASPQVGELHDHWQRLVGLPEKCSSQWLPHNWWTDCDHGRDN